MPQDLAQRSAASPKDVQVPGMHIMVQTMLHLQRQRPHAFAHVGMAHRYPYPGARGDRDHRRSDRSTAAASVGDAFAAMRTTALLISTTTARSEEHTSELQSLMRISYDVFCLKKKTINTTKL